MSKLKRGSLFNSVPAPKVGRTAFDMSFEHKLTCDMGKLIPAFCMECLPGDTLDIKPSALFRLQALISPMMQRVDASMLFFKEPYRHIWEGFEDFMTGGSDGLQKPEPPYFTLQDIFNLNPASQTIPEQLQVGSLLDYLGIPLPYELKNGAWTPSTITGSDKAKLSVTKLSALPLRAYAHIWNEYFRDQTLQDEIPFETTSGHISSTELQALLVLQSRCWKKDYFTSALPTPQRGPDVKINLAQTVTLGENSSIRLTSPSFGTDGQVTGLNPLSLNGSGTSKPGTLDAAGREVTSITGSANNSVIDLSDASAVTIVALRTAFKLQQFLERNNVAGGRYIESVLAHFGVKSSDARLQRPQFLGGGHIPIVISEIETNADSTGENNNVVGDLAGKGKAFGTLGHVKTFCEEHCFCIGLLSIIPVASYSQGISRMWTRFDKFDYYWPEMQFVGEQAIKQRELYFNYKMTQLDPNQEWAQDFGYTPRYAEYKYNHDRVSGDMRTSLSYWHMGRLFDKKPVLNSDFLTCKPTDRIYAVSDVATSQHVVADIWYDVTAVRKMAKYGTPKMS